MMTSKSVFRRGSRVGLLVALGLASYSYADDLGDANEAVARFRKTDPDLARFFKDSVGYAVFPSVGKGTFVVGAHGGGILYEGEEPVGRASLTQATLGFQFGGQAYAEIIFFQTDGVLSDFKASNLAFSGQVSAVALAAGAAADAKYQWGVAVFTEPKGGLMVEASLGGQKFSYTPFKEGQ